MGQGSLWKRVKRDPLALMSLGLLVFVALAAVLGPFLVPHDPNQASLGSVLAPPSAEHLLGGDTAGRDILARLLYASRYSLLGALIALGTALILGVTGGLIAGYYPGWFDGVSSWLTDLIMALPGVIVLLAARAVIGPSMWWSMFIFGIILAPSFFRLVRSLVHGVRDELYVDAAKVSGVSDFSIVFRHVLTVVRAPIIIQMSMVSVIAIAVQAGLEFLGVGDMTIPTWGSMLNEAYSKIYIAPQGLIWPGAMIAITCSALVLLASAMRDALERSRGASRSRRRKRGPAAGNTRLTSTSVSESTRSVETPESSALEVIDLQVAYDDEAGRITTVVHDVSFSVARGEVVGLIGESGSGKTQTAFSALRLLPAGGSIIRGQVRWKGRDLAALSEKDMEGIRGTQIAYVPQEPMSNLDPSFTIGSQLMTPLRRRLGLSRADARARSLDLLDRVGIPNPKRTFEAYPHEVSGGMAQRILIAGAVSCDPELLIADEPTSSLDVTVQADVLDLLRDLQQERNLGILLVTHSFGVVADICDRVAVMQQGRIVEDGPVRTILRRPAHDYTRSLLAAMLQGREPLSMLTDTGEEGTHE
ncbi:MAG: dipeptide/oligopeptide/nickel ABC transporter permease/ATP-binding protein [Cryobacterium sp.]|nr:dipeptide/oligopeptide/nickel ABC transporter permease/ATP-binding protein [Cryobacterium sp.]